jgi:hypothetical protein
MSIIRSYISISLVLSTQTLRILLIFLGFFTETRNTAEYRKSGLNAVYVPPFGRFSPRRGVAHVLDFNLPTAEAK